MDDKLMVMDQTKLAEFSNMGMKGVAPQDILPPEIRLIQKSSTLTDFVSREGNNPTYKQFFNTGRMEIYDTFDCYFLVANKDTFIKKDTNEELPMYVTVGVLADNPSIEKVFGMTLRSSASRALSSLFTAVRTNRQPMFAIKCTVESKEIQGKKGSWVVPVVRVGEFEKDGEKLSKLYDLAKQFDQMSVSVSNTEVDEVPF